MCVRQKNKSEYKKLEDCQHEGRKLFVIVLHK